MKTPSQTKVQVIEAPLVFSTRSFSSLSCLFLTHSKKKSLTIIFSLRLCVYSACDLESIWLPIVNCPDYVDGLEWHCSVYPCSSWKPHQERFLSVPQTYSSQLLPASTTLSLLILRVMANACLFEYEGRAMMESDFL